MLFVTVNYNTSEFLACMIRSVRKHHSDSNFVVFDNSDRKPIKENLLIDVEYLDNTHGKIIDFDKELEKYPERRVKIQVESGVNFGSAKHAMSIDWLCQNLGENFILMDSDVLLKKPIDFVDETFMVVGQMEQNGGKSRVLPYCSFMNVSSMKQNGVKYFDPKRMHGLSFFGNLYDTGASFYEDVSKLKNGLKQINEFDYIVHYGGGSWPNREKKIKDSSQFQNLSWDKWLFRYNNLWS